MDALARIHALWQALYPGQDKKYDPFQSWLQQLKADYDRTSNRYHPGPEWYRRAVVYALYVDLFAGDFLNLTKKLDYFVKLGIDTIWLLPILKSPRKDYGFDVTDYYAIDAALLDLSNPASAPQSIFYEFLHQAHARGIKLLFDIPVNHCSVEHPFFLDATNNPNSPYANYFVWSETTEKYKGARIIFKGLMDSNWHYHPTVQKYYFHRFYDFQPDWNYENPDVLVYMTEVLCHWKCAGVDGFRLDAIPYLWEAEETHCENLEKTHTVIKFFRAVIDYLSPGTLLLAEACQPPYEVVRYFGDGDEVQAAYHFPLMPQIFHSLAKESPEPIQQVMSKTITPDIPSGCCWFVFLRCHDELTLEMVTPAEREYLFNAYCHHPDWNFREGEGISSRLADLFKGDVRKMYLADSILLTIEGTPVLYYGSEFGKRNDMVFFEEMTRKTGYRDSRNLVRGPVDWNQLEVALLDHASLEYQVFYRVQKMLKVRQDILGELVTSPEFIDIHPNLLGYQRYTRSHCRIVFLHNLGEQDIGLDTSVLELGGMVDLLTLHPVQQDVLVVKGYGIYWLAPMGALKAA